MRINLAYLAAFPLNFSSFSQILKETTEKVLPARLIQQLVYSHLVTDLG